MLDIFNFFNKKSTSKDVAKDRLKFVLIHDRTNCSNQMMEMLRLDIIKVISNYMEIDEDQLDIQITQLGTQQEENNTGSIFNANIPIKSLRTNKNKIKQ